MTRPRIVFATTAVTLALALVYVFTWITAVSPVRERGSDFSASYVAAQILRDGHGTQLYDQQLEASRHRDLLPPNTALTLPYITPPTTALLALPFAWLDPGLAYRLFSLLQWLLVLLAAAVAVRAAPWPVALSGSAGRSARWATALAAWAGLGSLVLLLMGQWDGISVLGLACAYALWRRGWGGWAAFVLAASAALAKPHLAIGLGLFLLGRRRPREMAGAAAGVVVVAGVSLVVGGPGILASFASAVQFSAAHTPPASTEGASGLVASWLGTTQSAGGWAAILSAAALCACLFLGMRSVPQPADPAEEGKGAPMPLSGALAAEPLRRESEAQAPRAPDAVPPTRPGDFIPLPGRSDPPGVNFEPLLAGATALSLLATTHVLAHDMVLLAAPFAWTLAWATGRADGGRAIRVLAVLWISLSVTVALDAGNGAPAPPGRVVPLVLIASGLLSWWVTRRRRGESATTASLNQQG